VKVKKDKQNKFGNLTRCDAFERFTSYDMIILANALEKNVLRVISDLNINKNILAKIVGLALPFESRCSGYGMLQQSYEIFID
jgi:glycine betaine/choline ABC-type transport system substrate-binding protein